MMKVKIIVHGPWNPYIIINFTVVLNVMPKLLLNKISLIMPLNSIQNQDIIFQTSQNKQIEKTGLAAAINSIGKLPTERSLGVQREVPERARGPPEHVSLDVFFAVSSGPPGFRRAKTRQQCWVGDSSKRHAGRHEGETQIGKGMNR